MHQQLLLLCTDFSVSNATVTQLNTLAAQVKRWDQFVLLAEEHNMAPLVRTVFAQAQLSIPHQVKHQLLGLQVRHRKANAAKRTALLEICRALEAAHIDVIVLKGAWLAETLYAAPELRPMRDIDILVAEKNVKQAQAALQNIGYVVGIENELEASEVYHLETLTKTIASFTISVEVHFGFKSRFTAKQLRKPFKDLWAMRQDHQLESTSIYGLGPTDMLWQLYIHLISEDLRIGRIADVLEFAIKQQHAIDWQQLATHYPELLAGLRALLSARGQSAQLPQLPSAYFPSSATVPLHDWPPLSLASFKATNLSGWQKIRKLLLPSPTTLMVVFGLTSRWQLWLCRSVIYPAHLLKWIFRWAVIDRRLQQWIFALRNPAALK